MLLSIRPRAFNSRDRMFVKMPPIIVYHIGTGKVIWLTAPNDGSHLNRATALYLSLKLIINI